MVINYVCSKCKKIINTKDRIFNGRLCSKCFSEGIKNKTLIWSELDFNNVDEILEEKRNSNNVRRNTY